MHAHGYTSGLHRVLGAVESVIDHIVAPFHHKRYDPDLEFERKDFHKRTSSSYAAISHDTTRGHLHFLNALERLPYSLPFVDPNSENGLERQRMERRRMRMAAQNARGEV
jgi:hypothetical protein